MLPVTNNKKNFYALKNSGNDTEENNDVLKQAKLLSKQAHRLYSYFLNLLIIITCFLYISSSSKKSQLNYVLSQQKSSLTHLLIKPTFYTNIALTRKT